MLMLSRVRVREECLGCNAHVYWIVVDLENEERCVRLVEREFWGRLHCVGVSLLQIVFNNIFMFNKLNLSSGSFYSPLIETLVGWN